MKILIALVPFLLLLGCRVNRAPGVPEVAGPTDRRPGDVLVFTVTSADPEGDEVSYRFKWGDTSSVDWTPYYVSGQPVTRTHAYADTGSYPLQVKVRDVRQAESEWSAPLLVRIRYAAPARPERPQGPSACTVGVRHEFVTRCVHPQSESVRFQFDWGGVVGEWSKYVASGEEHAESHTFDTAGVYRIAARAQDRSQLVSEWSEYLEVPAIVVPGAPPRSVELRAATDSTLYLSWAPPDSGRPSAYGVFFRPVGSPSFTLAGETQNLSFEHFPAGMTGSYQVGARFGSPWFLADTVIGTVPVATDNITLYELNESGSAGYGWDRVTGLGSALSARDTLAPGFLDFYVTDFDTGSAGPDYFLATPDTLPFDPGDSIPSGIWRRTWLVGQLANDRDPLPRPADTLWLPAVKLGSTPEYVGCRTTDGHHAILKVTSVRPNRGDIRLQSWFQLVPGLRLIRH